MSRKARPINEKMSAPTPIFSSTRNPQIVHYFCSNVSRPYATDIDPPTTMVMRSNTLSRNSEVDTHTHKSAHVTYH